MKYRHKKTGRIYRWLAAAIDTTNKRDSTTAVVYCPDDNEHSIYVRETTEFHQQFESVCEYCEGTGVDPESFRSPLELPCPACKPSNAELKGAAQQRPL